MIDVFAEINLKGNKLSDKRLLKLVDQCRSKQVLDYVRQHCPHTGDSGDASASSKAKKGKKNKKEQAEVQENVRKFSASYLFI